MLIKTQKPDGSLSPQAQARAEIIQQVNRFRVAQARRRWPPFPARLLSQRHMNEAIRIARHNSFANEALIEMATGRRKP